jgi:DNA invertase Pin-like site-specific DNA recombinase
MNSKINEGHLDRRAYIYVRQSTPSQVVKHRESQRLQYNLIELAKQLGWQSSRIVILDRDLGCSASGTASRSDFDQLLLEVCASHVGAIFSVDASRLARNGREWHTLLEFCCVVDTLLIDPQASYDPKLSNDRLLLGLKGEFSEMELRVLCERSQAAIKQKAQRGELYLMISAGYVKTSDHGLRKDPDQRVQQAIDLVFLKFLELGSIRQTYKWFIEHRIEIPVAKYKNGIRTSEWRLPAVNTLGNMLKNPIYAGAYAYGKTKRIVEIKDGRRHIKKGVARHQQDWDVLIKDHHEAYIGWQEYQKNQEMIAHNCNSKRPVVTGSAGQGGALLTGLLRCGHCGSKLMTRYQGNAGQYLVYQCRGNASHQAKYTCISFGGRRVDQALSSCVLEVLSSQGLAAALEAIETLSDDHRQIQRQRMLALEQARYEVKRARRQYDAVDPEYRLAAAELERDWNEALKRSAELETEIAALQERVKTLSEQDRQDILSLAEDLSLVWNHSDSCPEIKKKIVRVVIKEVVAYVEQTTENQQIIKLMIHWQGGDHTQIELQKNQRGGKAHNATDPETIEIISALARIMPDKYVIGCLNLLGKRTASGLTWTPKRMCAFRNDHHIPVYKEGERESRGELSPEEVSVELKVSVSKVRKLIKQGILPAKQACFGAPWIIQKESLKLEHVRHAASSSLSSAPLTPNSKQQPLDFQ